MNKFKIIKELCQPTNFKKCVEICLEEGFDIGELKYHTFPQLLIYHDEDGNNLRWTDISFSGKNEMEFLVSDKWMKGVNNFFKHYKEITKFKNKNYIFVVKPNIIGKNHWYESNEMDHFEISYDCHSTIGPSLIFRNGNMWSGENLYYINGMKISKLDWLKYNREEKLKRLLK